MEIPLALYSFCFALYFSETIEQIRILFAFFLFSRNGTISIAFSITLEASHYLTCFSATGTPCGIFQKRPLPQPPAVSGPKAARLPVSIRSDS